jgi:hypothetical protein
MSDVIWTILAFIAAMLCAANRADDETDELYLDRNKEGK